MVVAVVSDDPRRYTAEFRVVESQTLLKPESLRARIMTAYDHQWISPPYPFTPLT